MPVWFDKNHIFFIGHSWRLLCQCVYDRPLSSGKRRCILSSLRSVRIYLLGLENEDYREQFLNDLLEEGIPYIHGTDEETLTNEIKGSAGRLSIGSCLQAISGKSILWISSPDDEVVSEAEETYPYIKKIKHFPLPVLNGCVSLRTIIFLICVPSLQKTLPALLENTDHKKHTY